MKCLSAIVAGSHVLASSASSVNNFEVVAFTPAFSGEYAVIINDNGTVSGNDYEPVGIAWSQESDIELFVEGGPAH